jgi:hypothetical protein
MTIYMPGLRTFLVEARRIPVDLADDLLQGFVADKVLSAGLVRHADQGRGKFRNFVLKSLNNYANTKLQREFSDRARKVGLDEGLANIANNLKIIDRFEQEWVRQVVRDALNLMERDCRERRRADIWEVFRLRFVEPMLSGADPVDYDQIIRQFNIATPRQAINLLANAKRSFLTCLRLSVGKYVSSDEQIESEISDLREIVGR